MRVCLCWVRGGRSSQVLVCYVHYSSLCPSLSSLAEERTDIALPLHVPISLSQICD